MQPPVPAEGRCQQELRASPRLFLWTAETERHESRVRKIAGIILGAAWRLTNDDHTQVALDPKVRFLFGLQSKEERAPRLA